jgi:uncharacterized protein (TIGR03435 family)
VSKLTRLSTTVFTAALIAVSVCFSSLGKPRIPEQTPTRLEFEVASVKVSPPALFGQSININLGTRKNGRVTLGNVTLSDCIKFAYGIVSDLQIAGPDWIKSEPRFDIIAQASEGTTDEQLLLMTQTLLADRLKLAFHYEQRPVPHVALTVGKGGIKFTSANPDGAVSLRNGRIVHGQLSMPILATLISRFERQLVLDMTELKGKYDIKLEWTPDSFRGRVPEGGGPVLLNGEAVDPNGSSLPTALSEQLGLRLESQKGPVAVLVVDHAEKIPTPN